jgi:leucyl aminopeptidase
MSTHPFSTPIRLHPAKSPHPDAMQVVLVPAGSAAPAHLSAALAGVSMTANFTRIIYNQDGGCQCVLGVDASCSTASLRLAAARAVRALPAEGAARIAFDTSSLASTTAGFSAGRAIAEGISLSLFDTKPYRGTASPEASRGEVGVYLEARFHRGFRAGLLLGNAVNTARGIAATPPNLCGPVQMTELSQALAKKHGMTFRSIDAKMAAKLGMGGLLAVGAGSAESPRLAILEWNPSGKSSKRPILLVGKSITYDSGGYSIKTDGGKGMKEDKSGACTMLGVMDAIATMNSKARVVCILAIAENMIDSNSYRLDDVITHCNGVSCEITNTDGEGRLVLADALAWGTKTYQPSTVIDAATLTGGVIVALGRTTAAAFCNDEELMARLKRASTLADEKVWQLPLDDELREQLKSDIADLHNVPSSRGASSGIGAAYLSYFVGAEAPRTMPTLPWVHLDIAGTATSLGLGDWNGLFPKGPTGWGVRTLVNLIEDLAG